MKRKTLVLAVLIGLSSAASANNWMKLLKKSDESRLRAEQARTPAIPVTAPISSKFGPRKHPITGEHRAHKGIDLAAKHGEPFVAIAEGRVVEATFLKGFGNTILIAHENGLTSRYAHASEVIVSSGDYVRKNQLIGRVGQTGLVTGPHLHLEVHLDGRPVDPLTLLSLTENTQYAKVEHTSQQPVPKEIVEQNVIVRVASAEKRKSDANSNDLSYKNVGLENLRTTKSSDTSADLEIRKLVSIEQLKTTDSTPFSTNSTRTLAGTHTITERSLWSISKQLKSELSYPSLKNIMALLVDINPNSFPTSDRNYRLASIPLYIPKAQLFEALLPEVVLTKQPVWLIAKKLKERYNTEASIYQIMHSLKSKNPSAFVDNDINRRLASVPLNLTSPEDFTQISHIEAYMAFQQMLKT